jgi:hypothetical protein
MKTLAGDTTTANPTDLDLDLDLDLVPNFTSTGMTAHLAQMLP